MFIDGPYFYVPFPKNHRFTGRDQLLEELITKLFAPDSFQKAALFGLGGAGKTQVALQVAYWTKEKKLGYSVFWVPALSVATFEQAYTDILKTVGIQCVDGEDVKQTVQTFLNSKAAGKWLLIIDNADDIDILFEFSGHERNIYNYLPTTDDGRILFTTRTREVATWVAGSNSMETPQMTEDDATDFLRKSLHQNLYPGNQDIALNGKAFDMHSLVHMATRLWGEKQDTLQEAKQDAILHMDRIFPSDDWDNRETWREYLPHGLKPIDKMASGSSLDALSTPTRHRISNTERRLKEGLVAEAEIYNRNYNRASIYVKMPQSRCFSIATVFMDSQEV
ncbi:unnamed protein product [Parascedosporium putredinis]|uniref:NB-ARC domain-containing protein n=1 Tax=Parascedosporium putredinis TaxID=1442378 RepID=A0A9P1M6G9_9PEZI|nr:unnamed protein product [Parascedosporium putredinis]CAI7989656.1 unnamed protein product [Parascedosporium putredinis]